MKLKKITYDMLYCSLKACSKIEEELTDDDHLRCYHIYPEWKPGVEIATYENGGGDDLVFVFKNNTVLIKGFDHESEVSPHAQDEYHVWPGIYENAPIELLEELDDEPFEKEDVTFCFWKKQNESAWSQGPIQFNNNEDDGSGWLLRSILLTPEMFISWAQDYYEEDFNKITHDYVHAIYNEHKMGSEHNCS